MKKAKLINLMKRLFFVKLLHIDKQANSFCLLFLVSAFVLQFQIWYILYLQFCELIFGLVDYFLVGSKIFCIFIIFFIQYIFFPHLFSLCFPNLVHIFLFWVLPLLLFNSMRALYVIESGYWTSTSVFTDWDIVNNIDKKFDLRAIFVDKVEQLHIFGLKVVKVNILINY